MAFCFWFLLCYTVFSVLSSFAIISLRKRELFFSYGLSVVWLLVFCAVNISLPRGAMDWSVIVAYAGDTHMVIENRLIYKMCILIITILDNEPMNTWLIRVCALDNSMGMGNV